jgi:hypothetical protein
MRVRHRIPSIFNLSMVDLLCCALGCVILLWLVNLRNARHHEEEASKQQEELTARLRSASGEREEAYGQLVVLAGRLAELEEDRAALKRQLALQRQMTDDLEAKYLAATSRGSDLEEKVRAGLRLDAGRRAALAELENKLKAAGITQADLLEKLKAGNTRLLTMDADLARARRRLLDDEARVHSLEKDLGSRGDELGKIKGRLAVVEAEKDALESRVGDLRTGMREARAEAVRLRTAAENRFAGITLTGKRVVFLVDMSGSMDSVDEKTPAPTKWPEVRNTVARLMRSLPELEKFQVIVFAEKASFLLGSDDEWLEYEARTSPDRAVEALAKIKPDGGTNMSAAMELAFRFRATGLDTVYLLSDGLPNDGDGLPSNPGRVLTEADKTDILSKYIRNKLRTTWNTPRPGEKQVRINAIGFFYESPEVGAFLWALARENDGSFVGMSKP